MHRDLKLDNIILENNKEIEICILDFGFATFFKNYRSLFTSCGTPGYIAPEILDEKEYDCKCDVYSLGIIFYIILTGKMAFPGT